MPRGWALGLTWQLPEHDKVNGYRDKMLEEISILFGGRIAEEVFMGQMSTGASNDFERATKLARDMVTRYGMSDTLGTMVYVDTDQDTYVGRMSSKTVSEATQQKVDGEIRRILDEQYALARRLIESHKDSSRRWPRPCWNGKTSTPSRSTTSWPACRRVRPRPHRRRRRPPRATIRRARRRPRPPPRSEFRHAGKQRQEGRSSWRFVLMAMQLAWLNKGGEWSRFSAPAPWENR